MAFTLTDIRRSALRSLIPPPRLRLSEWIEADVRLPEGTSALPGAVRLWREARTKTSVTSQESRTLNYSWQTAATLEGCEFIESEPD